MLGYALAAWGVGNCIAFAWPLLLSPSILAAGYLLALTGFAIGPGKVWVWAAFLITGALSSYFAGYVRGRISNSSPDAEQIASVWAFTNQITQVINLVAYVSAGFFLAALGFNTFAAVMLGACVIFVGATLRLGGHREDR